MDAPNESVDVSIHAPVWGATQTKSNQLMSKEFQSTHPCGVRPDDVTKRLISAVSIHAPVWGATVVGFLLPKIKELFQSTHPCGVRLNRYLTPVILAMFQSTHPCGVRRITLHPIYFEKCFNPRTRVGCDTPDELDAIMNVFQSTHPCGVRRFLRLIDSRYDVSIHAPVWGATITLAFVAQHDMFQSTHPCGVRPNIFLIH